MKTIVITGANGFVGKNLKNDLKQTTDYKIIEIVRETSIEERKKYLKIGDCIVHLAGINRSTRDSEFYEGNVELLQEMLEIIKDNPKKPSIIISSSIQADSDNLYGKSKNQAEKLVHEFSRINGNKVYIYRFPNLFGKWCKPNYNSVIATFCYNVANNKEIKVNDREKVLSLNYIDDVVLEIKKAIQGNPTIINDKTEVPNIYKVKLGEISDLIFSFRKMRINKNLPNLNDSFEKNMYSTYLSYLPKEEFSYPLKMNVDDRGSFTEFIRTPDRGQVSVNISKPGIVKGNHWHHTKNEKFLVVSGKGVIRFRLIEDEEIIEYFVSGEKLEVIDIPVGYTHNIENLGNEDMVTIMWANETFDPENPDTYFTEV
ncbi:polysaccharide biosynthesis C-terminal domain-containing protein [Staphylococcus equorum]|uniref:polysaccharide biosynthesis C-terminal domain-containing protein n=1 Tax=Staphylococcus equorum TaxID=246432 RepID=UPI0020CD948C|nr:NAD-dependent epimerase/dehydratase family protein [Staphylococcus equorum]MEB7715537.1 NAD-dependent epimerase/dehydratase family protein [Staphylococcus equorum]MEB7759892.1 NAD-dependent epimerase/dehydratase family protein [Staphylococcus equorum]MEB7762367.1 NAD-dependent epimerase/dehydratase family protein [Staphylococcus equorum]MEB7793467.1 NAD-dependent epimerase/dehydratase family protein [Staphylococcus equorum]UTT55863.1 NAD-dependent epimerase/dehydratase family protein [Staph